MRRYLLIVSAWMLCWTFVSAETLTATVTAYNEVSLSGDVPDNIAVTYEQQQDHHFKGRLLAGESAILTLSGLPAGELAEVRLQMHSNTSAGSGSLSMTIAGEEVWSIANNRFASAEWAGSYTKDWVDICHIFSSPLPTGDISIVVESSVNSLYISSFTFVYNALPAVPHTVSFVTHTTTLLNALHESYAGEGVLLPTIEAPNSDWSFTGWVTTDILSTTTRPAYHQAGHRYYPTEDVTLYALYEDHAAEALRIAPAQSVSDGEYAIVSRHGMLYGAVTESGFIHTLPYTLVNTNDDSFLLQTKAVEPMCRYDLICRGDSFLIYHPASGTYIGWRQVGTKTTLIAQEAPWGLLQNDAGATFINSSFTLIDETLYTYLLCEEYTDEGEYVMRYRKAICNDTLTYYHLLFPLDGIPSQPRQATWSSYPGMGYGTEPPACLPSIDWTEDVIVRTPEGRIVGSGIWHRMPLPRGVYIIQQGQSVLPIVR